MCVMLPRRLNAAYNGLIAAPGIPNAMSTPSRSITRTAASAAVIFGIAASPLLKANGPIEASLPDSTRMA